MTEAEPQRESPLEALPEVTPHTSPEPKSSSIATTTTTTTTSRTTAYRPWWGLFFKSTTTTRPELHLPSTVFPSHPPISSSHLDATKPIEEKIPSFAVTHVPQISSSVSGLSGSNSKVETGVRSTTSSTLTFGSTIKNEITVAPTPSHSVNDPLVISTTVRDQIASTIVPVIALAKSAQTTQTVKNEITVAPPPSRSVIDPVVILTTVHDQIASTIVPVIAFAKSAQTGQTKISLSFFLILLAGGAFLFALGVAAMVLFYHQRARRHSTDVEMTNVRPISDSGFSEPDYVEPGPSVHVTTETNEATPFNSVNSETEAESAVSETEHVYLEPGPSCESIPNELAPSVPPLGLNESQPIVFISPPERYR